MYEGTLLRGKRQGQGTMRYATGEEATGEWQDGALAEASNQTQSGDDTTEETQSTE